MAFLGLRTQDAGLGSSSTVDLLVKALTGDPEREMALARGRSDLELDAYRQKQMEAAAAQYQAEADTKAWELNQRQTNAPAIANYYAGLVDEPVAVTTPGAVPAPVPNLPDPVPIEIGQVTDQSVRRGVDGNATATLPGSTAVPADTDPVPVGDIQYPAPALQVGPDIAQLPQPNVLPGEVVPPSPEEMAAYQREREAAEARANLIVAGGGNAEQVAKGVGIGEGAVMSGSDDPEMRRRAELLYAGKTPEGTAGGVPNTEAGGNARLYAGMMLDSELLLKEATPENVPDLVTTLAGLPDENITMGMITNLAVDPASKRYLAAAYRWTIAQLRKTTGATISKPELSGTLQSYIPLAGDSMQGIVEKERARRVFEHGLVEQGYGYQSAAYKEKIAEFQRLYGIDLTDAGTTDTASADDNIPIIDPATPAGDVIYDRLPIGAQYRLPGSDEIHTKTAEN